MPTFSSQHFAIVASRFLVQKDVVDISVAVADRIISGHQDRAVVFTLAHLAALSGIPYVRLREWVGRRGSHPYREWLLAKQPGRRRTAKPSRRHMRRIATPAPGLLYQQRWIVHRILHTAARHKASVAFHRKSDIVEAARLHCRYRWLIKLDVENFFESVYEPKVFQVFKQLGYPRLLAFELTRLCTRVVPPNASDDDRRHTSRHASRGPDAYALAPAPEIGQTELANELLDPTFIESPVEAESPTWIAAPASLPLGSLPQGAPTSPLLANLAVRSLDDAIQSVAVEHGLIYTRYADDIALSTDRRDFNRDEASVVIGKVLRAMEIEGLRPHRAKTRVVPPGARKIVLGLTVDGTKPRLTREYRNKLRLHAHILGTRGIPPSKHARSLRFTSVLSMRRHIEGKIAHARRVEPDFAARIANAIASVNWTL